MNRQPRALLSVLLVGALLLTGWMIYRDLRPAPPGPRVDAPPDTPVRGGTLTASLRSEPRSFNRLVQNAFATDLYSLLTQAKLVSVNRNTHELEPALAESWTESADHRTFTLTLRDGVQWSDGDPFTSADVVFSFKAVYDPRSGSVIAESLKIDGREIAVTAPDARTVVVTYPAPYGVGIRLLDNLTLMPQHKLQAALDAGTFGQAWGAATPVADLVALGPFKLARYEPGQRLVFDRNEHYWKKDAAGQALPYLDHLVLEIVPDQNAELVRLQSGALDTLQQQIRPEDLATLRPLVAQGRLNLIELGVSTDPDAFFFNLRAPYWARDPRGAWITRQEFRQAISYAVDREAFANTVFLGAAVPIWGPITPGNPEWFSPNVKRYPYSLDRARELLAGIGLENRDADEWLEDEKGTEARFTLLTYRGNSSLERSAQVLKDDLRAVGIGVDVQAIEQNALIQDHLLKGEFDAIYFVYFATDLDPALNKDFWLSSGGSHIWNIAQPRPATEWEAELDDLTRRMAAAVDLPERQRLFKQMQDVFAENLPVLYFVSPRLYMGASTRVGGIRTSILRPQLLWSADSMFVRGAPASQ